MSPRITFLPVLFLFFIHASAQEPFFKIYFGGEGMYRLTGEMLQNAGANLSEIQPQTLQLFSDGQRILPYSTAVQPPALKEVAIMVEDGGDNQFDPTDFIVFYGESVNRFIWDAPSQLYRFHSNPYDTMSCYWLRWNKEPGKRILPKNGNPVTSGAGLITQFTDHLHREQDRYNVYKTGLTWTWNLFGKTNSFVQEFILPEIAGSNAELQGQVYRYKPYELPLWTGNVEFYFNSSYINSYSTQSSFQFNEAVSLLPGTNVIQLEYIPAAPEDSLELVGLDWMEIHYPRFTGYQGIPKRIYLENLNGIFHIFYRRLPSPDSVVVLDITDPCRVRRIVTENDSLFEDTLAYSPRSYYFYEPNGELPVAEVVAAQRDAFSPADGTDYLLVTHSQMLPEILPLKFHRESFNGFQVKVVTVEEIYDEFGFGRKDPTALRNFIKFAHANWNPAPRFVVLAGNGYYDYRNLTGNYPVNWVPTFEIDGDNNINSRATDDYFAALNFIPTGNIAEIGRSDWFFPLLSAPEFGYEPEFARSPSDSFPLIIPELAIGRLPADSPEELAIMVQKTIESETHYTPGLWRLSSLFIADDEYSPGITQNFIFMTLLEDIQKEDFFSSSRLLKLYEHQYPFINQEKPSATRQLINWINNGNRVILFSGYYNETQWTHENLFNLYRDLSSVKNYGKYSILTAMGGLYKFDDKHEGLVPSPLKAADSGVQAVVTGNHHVFLASSSQFLKGFYQNLISNAEGYIGKAAYLAKSGSVNDQKYMVFGDPALRLTWPDEKVQITTIQPDTLKARSLVQISGTITPATGSDSLILEVREPGKIREVPGSMPPYEQTGQAIFRGIVPVSPAGEFSAWFVVPDDVPHDTVVARGKLFAYCWNSINEGMGFIDSLLIGGLDSGVVDVTPPQITLSVFEKDTVGRRAFLRAELFDENGINLSSLGNHQPMLFFDRNYQDTIFVSEFFTYQSGSYQQGSLLYPLPALPAGDHQITLVVHDNYNNMNRDSLEFVITSLESPSERVPQSVSLLQNYPNPFNPETTIPFRLVGQQNFQVKLEIFNILGQRIRSLLNKPMPAGDYALKWDGQNAQGQMVSSGIYIYRLAVYEDASGGTGLQGRKIYVKAKKMMVLK
ncbi:MAG: type IX secretion system sortase PorU [Calditrichia bacterium]